MSDPTSLAHQGDYLARRLNRNVSTDLSGLLTSALSGYPEPDEPDDPEPAIAHEPAVDFSQGRGGTNRPAFDELQHNLEKAIGLR